MKYIAVWDVPDDASFINPFLGDMSLQIPLHYVEGNYRCTAFADAKKAPEPIENVNENPFHAFAVGYNQALKECGVIE